MPSARRIAGDADDEATLALARVAAEAQLDLARIRQLKKAVIESVMALGDPETSPFFRPEMDSAMKSRTQQAALAERDRSPDNDARSIGARTASSLKLSSSDRRKVTIPRAEIEPRSGAR